MNQRSPYVVAGIVKRPRYLTIATATELTRAYECIRQIVAEEYKIPPESIQKQGKKRETKAKVEPRQIVMFLLYAACGYGVTVIGEILGGFNHSTVVYALEAVDAHIHTEPDYKARLKVLWKKLQDEHPELLIVGKPVLE